MMHLGNLKFNEIYEAEFENYQTAVPRPSYTTPPDTERFLSLFSFS